jgi:outer membrane protein insertion porin family/translocation and assembly module TamA
MVRAMPLVSGSRPHPLVVSAVALLALAGSACYRVPEGKKAVADVTIAGTHDVDVDAILTSIATKESSRFLGIWNGVLFEYEVFDPYALQKDLQRVERFLRAEGYYDAHVRAARVEERDGKVYVTIAVDQGEPVLVDAITIAETTPIDQKTRDALQKAIRSELPIGQRLSEDRFAASESAALEGLTSAGHAAAKVNRHAEVDLATHRARLVYTVDAGPLGRFGPVRLEGLGELPPGPVRRIFGIEEGRRYSSEALKEGRQALLDLGVFASVDVIEDMDELTRTATVPITVRTQPAKLRALLLGAGLELDALKTDLHVQAGWQDSNFLGGLRKLDVTYKPGIILYPMRFPTLLAPTELLYEHRLGATLRQPSFLEKRTAGLARVEYNVYPVLLPNPTEDVLGYHEVHGAVGLQRTFRRAVSVGTGYDLQSNFPFDYVGHVTTVETLVISYLSFDARLDLRDDRIKPHRGLFVGADMQLAGGPLQGDADDVRVQPEVRGYVPLPWKMTLALRGSVGFLFPFNYGKYAEINFRTPGPSRAERSERDYQILFFRGFFGGGPSSNRGYPLRGVGPHDFIPYLSPAGQSVSAGGCDPHDRACSLPTGGLSLWELNAELRLPISGPLSTALFCDSGDVSPFSLDLRLDRPHLSCGTGARYDTPVGPIRLDAGVRLPGLQTLGSSSFEVEPARLFGVLPVAVALGIGEAF